MKKRFIAEGSADKFGARAFSRRNWLLVVFFSLLALAPPTKAQPKTKNVLVLSGGRGRVSINLMESSLRTRFQGPVNFSVVDLENPRFEQESYQQNLAEALRGGYSAEKLDLVIAVMTPSLQFAVRYHEKVFPGVPIVFMSVSTRLPDQMWPGVTGVASAEGIPQTIDLALRLHPDTKAVAVITDVSEVNKDWLTEEHSDLLLRHPQVTEIDLVGPVNPELLQRIAALPPHTVALFQLFPQDANQPAFGAYDVLAAVAQRVPTYSILPAIILDRGGIGGATYDPTKDAVLAGEIAARVLSGERPDNIPVAHNSDSQVSVDWRQLRRWNIAESVLPPGTRVLYREPSLWARGRKYFLAGIAVIAAQTLLIFGLFWQRARRKETEAELRRSEEKFSKSFRESPLAISIASMKDGRYIDVNETFEQQTGWRRDELISRSPFDLGLWVDPDQRSQFIKRLLAEGKVRDLEVKVRRKDGQIRTALGSAELIEVNGDPCALSVIADVTERKQAEAALATLTGRLIEAQEEERKRIARELHDDYNQRLAMLAIDLERLAQNGGHSSVETGEYLHQLSDRASKLGDDLHSLSHRLHSSTLETLGLVAGVKAFCREFAEQQGVQVDFVHENVPRRVPADDALCMFRITQEALRNVKRHSGADRAEVRLEQLDGRLHLSVSDRGRGFDPNTPPAERGIGIRSMEERLRLLGGKLELHSQLMEGTRIEAWLPIKIATAS
jgi:PAS domain S-box-containing protein